MARLVGAMMYSNPESRLSRRTASLIGRVCQASSSPSVLSSSVDRLGVSHASLRSRLRLDGSLHALVGRSGEPRLWTRSKRSSHLRLHPDHRSHLDALTSELGLDVDRPHAGVATVPQRNSDPSIHMRCRITASLRATAMTARRWPRVLARRTPQAFNVDHWALRVSSEWAAT